MKHGMKQFYRLLIADPCSSLLQNDGRPDVGTGRDYHTGGQLAQCGILHPALLASFGSRIGAGAALCPRWAASALSPRSVAGHAQRDRSHPIAIFLSGFLTLGEVGPNVSLLSVQSTAGDHWRNQR